MKVGSAAYDGDVINHGQMTVYDDAEVAGRVDDLDWWRQDRHVTDSDPVDLMNFNKYIGLIKNGSTNMLDLKQNIMRNPYHNKTRTIEHSKRTNNASTIGLRLSFVIVKGVD